MPTFPYVKRSYQHLDHPRKKRKSHYRLGLNRAIASSTVLHEEASALRSQYYLSRIDLMHYPMGRVVLQRSSFEWSQSRLFYIRLTTLPRAAVRITAKARAKSGPSLPQTLRITTLFLHKWKGRSRVGALRYRLGLPRRDRHTGPLGSPFYASGKDAQSLRPGPLFSVTKTLC